MLTISIVVRALARHGESKVMTSTRLTRDPSNPAMTFFTKTQHEQLLTNCQPVERDEHFDADQPLSAYADEARRHGRIVT